MVCKRLDYVFLPWRDTHGPISCGTYATRDENGQGYSSGFKYLKRGIGNTMWWYKWYTAARAVALGYNVLAIDSDCLILDDFYFRVKAPSPLAKYNMFTQAEGKTLINSGWTYVQNAASNGPVAWMLYDMVHKLVRWAEDPSELFKMAPYAAANNMIWGDDQESMSDVLFSCINGRTSYYIISYNIRNDEAAWKKLGVNNSLEHLDRLQGMKYWKMETFPVSGELAGLVCEHLPDIERCRREPATSLTAQTVELRMPHSGGVFPPEWGGYPFAKEAGPITLAYRQSFKDLGVPLPPDPEDPATEAAARATKPEHFVLMQSFVKTDTFRHPNPMGWVQNTWTAAGYAGLWHTHLAPPGGHLFQGGGHVFAGMFPFGPATKYLALSSAGHFDWRVAARLAGSPHKVFVTAWEGPEVELRRVVAYSPGLIPDSITKEDFIVAVNGLAQLGVALGAVVAWPELDCNTEWVQAKQFRNKTRVGPQTVPWTYLNTGFTVYPFGRSLETLKCQWNGFHQFECLQNKRPNGIDVGRGLTPIEFDHLLSRTRRQVHAQLGHDAEVHVGTLLKLAKDGAVPPSSTNHPAMAEVSYPDLLAANTDALLHSHSVEHVPILWVDRLVAGVSGMTEELNKVYDNWNKSCIILHYFDAKPLPHDY
ncbi:hypothetical protein HXX76_009462 [Chlamydomonas incerta]|uniref:Nucleotide-diphospho-sugar transferase domain-containing protein n=1 Tax=Chlamydomonas incerta TaxID=51695 RepID=A0A835STZ2_CHLIN|nr:hypothetical protein HXX76_009462 [Chlamydomonas incerta]|eukprot:KAG2431447.1 hypothetical protein HXX76_009462 [Chlamydomonas incerta]